MNDKDKLLKLIRGDNVPQMGYFYGIPLTRELLAEPEILIAFIKCIVRDAILEANIETMKELELLGRLR